jgi:ABC-type antimicrobial peptide transport system permease subunit
MLAIFTIIISGALAGYIPSRKASIVKPIIALRDD